MNVEVQAEELSNLLQQLGLRSDFAYLLKCLRASHRLLVKYAPLKVGDRVILTSTPPVKCTSSMRKITYSGAPWAGSSTTDREIVALKTRKFIAKGALATVRDVEIGPENDKIPDHLSYGLEFDAEKGYVYSFNDKCVAKTQE